jgi:hypothetical protein
VPEKSNSQRDFKADVFTHSAILKKQSISNKFSESSDDSQPSLIVRQESSFLSNSAKSVSHRSVSKKVNLQKTNSKND